MFLFIPLEYEEVHGYCSFLTDPFCVGLFVFLHRGDTIAAAAKVEQVCDFSRGVVCLGALHAHCDFCRSFLFFLFLPFGWHLF